jgi:hypothetical protein
MVAKYRTKKTARSLRREAPMVAKYRTKRTARQPFVALFLMV